MDKHDEAAREQQVQPAYDVQPPYGQVTNTSSGNSTPTSTFSRISISNTDLVFGADVDPDTQPGSHPFRTVFACIKLQLNDTLLVHRFPTEIVSLIRGTIPKHWSNGIQKEDHLDRWDEENTGRSFKLKGNPWLVLPQNTIGVGSAVPACRLIVGILDSLSRAGWVLTLTAGTSSGMQQHKPTLIFRHQEPAPADQQWIVLATMQVGPADTLRIIDGPVDLQRDLTDTLVEAGMTNRYGRTFEGVYDIELGRHRCTNDNADVPELMLVILSVLDRHGFTVAASINQSWDHGKPDTWYCCRPEGWSQGLPVFHR